MKIEIELREIETLREKLRQAEDERAELKRKLKAQSKEEYEKKAINVANALFVSYIKQTFKELGFDIDNYSNSIKLDDRGMVDLFKQDYISTRQKIDLKLDVNLTKNMATAFLKLGVSEVKMNELITKKDLIK